MAKSLHIQAKNSDMKAFHKGILNKIILVAVKTLLVNFHCADYSSKVIFEKIPIFIGDWSDLKFFSSFTRDYNSTPS